MKIERALLNVEQLSESFEFQSATLKRAKEIRDAVKEVKVRYKDMETELEDALKVENSKLMRLALKRMDDVDAFANQVGDTFNFKMKVWRHECSVLKPPQALLLAKRVRQKLALLDLREKEKFDALQALGHAIKTRDAKAIEACVLECTYFLVVHITRIQSLEHNHSEHRYESRSERLCKIESCKAFGGQATNGTGASKYDDENFGARSRDKIDRPSCELSETCR